MARKKDDGRNKPLYMISVAAELTGMHPQTLRVYEQKGLINPGLPGATRACILARTLTASILSQS